MRRRKWLIVAFIILITVNGLYFLARRYFDLPGIINEKVEELLAKELKAHVKIAGLDFTDREINLSEVEIKAENYSLVIKQIFVEYNLFDILLRKKPYLRKITIFEPEVSYRYLVSEKADTTETTIPDLSDYFTKAVIFGGKLSVTYETKEATYCQEADSLSLELENYPRMSEVSVRGNLGKQGIFKGFGRSENGKIRDILIDLKDYKPQKISVAALDTLSFKLNAYIRVTPQNVYYKADFDSLLTGYAGYGFHFGGLLLSGDSKKAQFASRDLIFFGSAAVIKGKVTNPLTDPQLDIVASMEKTNLHFYEKNLHGFAKAVGRITGKISDPYITIDAQAEKLDYDGIEFSDVLATAKYNGGRRMDFTLKRAKSFQNIVHGEAYYHFDKIFRAKVFADSLHYRLQDFSLTGTAYANVEYHKKTRVDYFVPHAEIFYRETSLGKYDFQGDYYARKLSLIGTDEEKHVDWEGAYFFGADSAYAKLKLKQLDPASFNGGNLNWPHISGNNTVTYKSGDIVLKSELRAVDKRFGKIDGKIFTDFTLNLQNKHLQLDLRTMNGRFNDKQFELFLTAESISDSLYHAIFAFNDEVNGDIFLSDKLAVSGSIEGKNIRINEYLKYYLNHYEAENFGGKINFRVQLTNNILQARLTADSLEFGERKGFSASLLAFGSMNNVVIDSLNVYRHDHRLLNAVGRFTDKKNLEASLYIPDVPLSAITNDKNDKGILDINADFSLGEKNRFYVEAMGNNLLFKGMPADSVEFNAVQTDSLFIVNKLLAQKKGLYLLTAQGSYGYNFITHKNHFSSKKMNIDFEGDLFKFLAGESNFFKDGKSDLSFNLQLANTEEGLSIAHGKLNLEDGYLQLKDQPEAIRNFNFDLNIENGQASIQKFEFKMGTGKLLLKNRLQNDGYDLTFGSLNLGHLYLRTTSAGLSIFFPAYMPTNSLAQAIIKGRSAEFAEIKGPTDDISVTADILVNNGKGIYPPHTSNLLNLVTRQFQKEESSGTSLPFSADLKISFMNNIRYVTSPVDLLIDPGSYLWLQYDRNNWLAQEINITSHAGNLDLFGTNFSVDEVVLLLNRYQENPYITGKFYKKTGDGTLVNLDLVAPEDKSSLLTVKLSSDNPDDTSEARILAKLTYNRSIDELSNDEQQSILQNEAINLAGVSLETALTDRVLTPVENNVRKWLRLDNLSIRTGWVQNIVNQYYNNNPNQEAGNNNNNTVLSKSILLNNLSVDAGKYLSPEVFLGYSFYFEKSTDYAEKVKVDFFQTFALRYDLPEGYKMSYKFLWAPENRDNAHEVMLEKSFRFF